MAICADYPRKVTQKCSLRRQQRHHVTRFEFVRDLEVDLAELGGFHEVLQVGEVAGRFADGGEFSRQFVALGFLDVVDIFRLAE
jgi:hypothetical protein